MALFLGENKFLKLNELLKNDSLFIENVKKYNHINEYIENEKFNKYINKMKYQFYKDKLIKPENIETIKHIINIIHYNIMTDEKYLEIKEKIFSASSGCSVMGSCLYIYVVPKNIRKKEPEKETIFNFGYINGEGWKETFLMLLNDTLKYNNIKTSYECGSMD